MTTPVEFADAHGRQHERTTLAWLRTTLATVVVGLFMLRYNDGGAERWVVAVVTALGLIGVLVALRARTAILEQRLATVGPARVSVPLLLGSLVLLQLAGLVLAF
jgi:hypothetical protein